MNEHMQEHNGNPEGAALFTFITSVVGLLVTWVTWDGIKLALAIILLVISIIAGLLSIRFYKISQEKARLEIEKLKRELENLNLN